jgi:hypothetical protein
MQHIDAAFSTRYGPLGDRRRRIRKMPMQESQREAALQYLDEYEQMLDTFTEQAKAYWGLWGPLGEHMVRGVDGWADQQRSYLQWLRQKHGSDNHSQPTI